MRVPAFARVVLAVVALLAADRALAASAPERGDQAPEIRANDWLNTKPLTLAKLRGKIVIVEFWATWCPPCRRSIPHLIELHEKYAEKGVVLVSLTNEPVSRIGSFVKDRGMTYAIGAGSRTAGDYGVRGIPHAYIVDPNGKVAWHGHPMSGMVEKLEEALHKTPPSLLTAKELARAKNTLALAREALDSGRFARVVALLDKIRTMDLPTDIEEQVMEVSKELGVFAADAIETAMGLVEAGKPIEAIQACEGIAREFAGTSAAEEARELHAQLSGDPETTDLIRERRAEKALASAEALFDAGQHTKARAEFEQVVATFGGTPQAEQAEARLEAIASDPVIAAGITSAEAGRQIRSWLSMARNWARAGNEAKAKSYYQQIVDAYPDRPEAKVAREELDRLK